MIDAEDVPIRESDENLSVLDPEPGLEDNHRRAAGLVNPSRAEAATGNQRSDISGVDRVGNVLTPDNDALKVSRSAIIGQRLVWNADDPGSGTILQFLGKSSADELRHETLLNMCFDPVGLPVDTHERVGPRVGGAFSAFMVQSLKDGVSLPVEPGKLVWVDE
jgi:hypothetical protein